MYISDSDRELMLKYISSKKSNELKTKSISELLDRSIEGMTVEEVKEILRVSKRYPDNEDIDESRSMDIIKVITRYIGRFAVYFMNLNILIQVMKRIIIIIMMR